MVVSKSTPTGKSRKTLPMKIKKISRTFTMKPSKSLELKKIKRKC